jgi:hypothetical protein
MIVFTIACSKNDDVRVDGDAVHYNISSYFDSLERIMPEIKVERIIYRDGVIYDSALVVEYNVKEDFAVLKKGDISAVSNVGKYDIIKKEKDTYEYLLYDLKDGYQEQVKRLHLVFKGKQIDSVFMDRQFKSLIANNKVTSSYKANVGYLIHTSLRDRVNGKTIVIDKEVKILSE